MSSTASSVKMLAMSWSKSVTISSATSAGGVAAAAAATYGRKGSGGRRDRRRDSGRLRSGRRGRGRKLRGTRGGDDSFFELFGGLFDARQQPAVRLEEPGRLVEMRGHGAHGIHAVGQQLEIRAVEPDAAVECLAYPVFERRGEANAVPGFGHARAARQRVAGAIGLFADHVRRAARTLGLHVAQHRVDVDLRLAAVDLAQLQVATRFFFRRRQHHVLAGLLGRLVEHPIQFGLRGLSFRSGPLRARLQRGDPPGRLEHVGLSRVERALESFHRGASGWRTTLFAASACARSTMSWARAGAALPASSAFTSSPAIDHGIAHRGQDRRRALQRVLDDPVEQVLDGPGEFADVGGTDHAAGALQGVERAAHTGQRVRLEGVLFPGREQLADARDLFARLFYI